MNKVIKVALQSMYSGMNIDALLEVVGATNNPIIATEKLLGIFEVPELKPFWRSTGQDREAARKMLGYNWNTSEDNQVRYEYLYEEKVTRFLNEGSKQIFDAPACRTADREELVLRHGKYKEEGEYIHPRTVTVVRTSTSSCSVETWMQYHCME